jgi:hypothetical protein
VDYPLTHSEWETFERVEPPKISWKRAKRADATTTNLGEFLMISGWHSRSRWVYGSHNNERRAAAERRPSAWRRRAEAAWLLQEQRDTGWFDGCPWWPRSCFSRCAWCQSSTANPIGGAWPSNSATTTSSVPLALAGSTTFRTRVTHSVYNPARHGGTGRTPFGVRPVRPLQP